MTSSLQIPLVDFAKWTTDESSRRQIAHDLVSACKKVGFVYIINHSLSESLLDEAFRWSRLFFDLPQDDKLKAPHPEGWAVHRGYSWPGLEKVSQVMSATDDQERIQHLREIPDIKESYDIGSDQNASQPNQWIPEEGLPGFREFMTRFYWECFQVGGDVLRALAIGMGLDNETYLLEKHSGHNNQLRLLNYPPVPAEIFETERAVRCPAHTDWSSITLLFQDDCGGLEIEDVTDPGNFVPAVPVKNAIIMNVGDLLQRWSNGSLTRISVDYRHLLTCSDHLRSTSHRVTVPPSSDRFEGEDRMTSRRFSIPYFLSPDPESVIECIQSCTGVDEPAKYEPITQADYNQMRASMQY